MTDGTREFRKNRRVELIVLLIGCLLFVSAIVLGSKSEAAGEIPLPPAISEDQDYSKFQHRNPTHSRMPCLLCHKRDDNSAVPKLPGHMPCAGCHTEQFDDKGSQICSICHTNRETGATKSFPRLRSFNVQFDHAQHLRQSNCATCHKPSRRGVAFSIPSGLGAHNACFQCHEPRKEIGGRNIGSCGTCHQPGSPKRNSDWAIAYTKNFDHSEHRGVGNLNCSSCHTVRAGMPRGRQVSAPAASMHLASNKTQNCGTCHDNKRAFGGQDFSDCKRCHQGASFRF